MSTLEDTFMTLVRDNDVRLQRICQVYAADAEAQKDLYQEILMQLWRALPSYTGGAQPGTWLYRVALNTALGQRRTAKVRHEDHHDTLADSDVRLADDSPTPQERLEAQQRLQRLYAAIGRLGDLDKALVTLFLDDRSYRDMAQVLGISESNVGVKLHRIKKELAAWLAEDDS
ncbi:MAG TPA: sigma-70 family RNA polymerase sigma factor [Gemmatimonadaceae bacterium]